MKKNHAIFLVIAVFLASLPIMQNMPRHVNPSEIPETSPNMVDLLSIYTIIIDRAVFEDYVESLRNLDESMKTYIPKDLKYIYDRFNELLRNEIDMLNTTKKYIDATELSIVLGLLQDARRNLSMATYTLAEANITYIELKESVKEFEKMFKIPGGQLTLKLSSLEKLILRYFNDVTSLSKKLEALKEAALEDTELKIWVDRENVWVGEEVKLSGFLRTLHGYQLIGRMISIYLDGEKAGLLKTGSNGFFTINLSTSNIYKPEINIYAEYKPSGDDVGVYKTSRSNTVTVYLSYEQPLIYAEVSNRKVYPGQTIHIRGWVNTSLGRLPERIFLNAVGITLSKKLYDGSFDFPLKIQETLEEGAYLIKLSTQASGIIAPSEKTLTIYVEKLPVNVTYLAPAIVLAGGDITIIGRVTGLADQYNMPLPHSKITINILDRQHFFYSDQAGYFTASVNIPLTIMTGNLEIPIYIEPQGYYYKKYLTSIEVYVLNPLTILAPSIFLAIVLVYLIPLVKEVGAEIVKKPSPEIIGETYTIEVPRREFFYTVAAEMVGDATGVYVKGYETIREYLLKVRNILGEAYPIFEEISMLAERELYGGAPADKGLVKELLKKLRKALEI